MGRPPVAAQFLSMLPAAHSLGSYRLSASWQVIGGKPLAAWPLFQGPWRHGRHFKAPGGMAAISRPLAAWPPFQGPWRHGRHFKGRHGRHFKARHGRHFHSEEAGGVRGAHRPASPIISKVGTMRRRHRLSRPKQAAAPGRHDGKACELEGRAACSPRAGRPRVNGKPARVMCLCTASGAGAQPSHWRLVSTI